MISDRSTNERQRRGPRARAWRFTRGTRFLGVLTMVMSSLVVLASPASAGVALSVPPSFPSPVQVGQTGLPATLSATNGSNGLNAPGNVNVTDLRLVPSCTNFAIHCVGGANPGVFALSPTGLGETGTACAGIIFNINLIDATVDEYQFVPAGGYPIVLGPPPSGCTVDFTFSVLKMPIDSQPNPGVQTNQLGFASATHPDIPPGSGGTGPVNTGGQFITVTQAAPTIATTPSPSTTPVGGTIHDTAVLANGVNPTGTILFNLYGTADPTCVAAPIATSTAIVSGNNTYPSGNFATGSVAGSGVGTLHWIATYSGDVNNLGAASLCTAEPVVVTQVTPTLNTTPSAPPTVLPGTVTDTATLSGGFSPTGTITFTLFSDANCTAAVGGSTSIVPVAGNGPYNSLPATILTAGTYQWVATYSGDTNNKAVTSLCGSEPVTAKATPTIVTTATPATVPAGTPAHDTAVLSGGAAPTGSITFRLYGPSPAPNCASAPVFTSPPVTVAGNGSYDSPTFAPAAIGSYYWTATYTGDTLNNAVTTACGAAGETLVVTQATPTVVTQASAPVTAGAGQVTDTATVSGGATPTGTITFRLYGPVPGPSPVPNCAGTAVFTSTAVPVAGPGSYTSTPGFTPTAAGTYFWTATYSGDANNVAVTTACGAANESVLVAPATPMLSTNASGAVPPGGPVHDTAHLTGGVSPTGTITFRLYGPSPNPDCSGAPAFTSSAVPVAGVGDYDSTPLFNPTTPGTYYWTAAYSGDANNTAVTTACGAAGESVVVSKGNPSLVTNVSVPVATAGQTFHDTATLSGGISPTGTITFNLYGPQDPNCGATPVFTAAVPVNHGNGNYDSPDFTANSAGLYRWRASYSGDGANNPVPLTPCADPLEQTTVNKANPALVTFASGSVPVNGQIHDRAVLSGGTNPTGTITFKLYGPDDATNCTATPAFTTTASVSSGNGSYDSPSFSPAVAGTYRWTATYGGDANNNAVGPTPCTDPAEAVVVTKINPVITTTASPAVPLGGQVHDTATLTGGASPTGTITFNLYGPNDPTCSNAAVFTATAPVNGGNGSYQSPNFTPAAPGTYRWRASYGGDANNSAAGPTACNDPAESVLVRGAPAITTTASPTVPEGGNIHDTANLTGGLTPTGTIMFNLYGPNDATCANAPIVSTTVPVNGNGTYQSPDFPTQINGVAGPGTYRWRASYSGDANNDATALTSCADPNESVVVSNVPPAILIQKAATPPTLPEPGGLFTFNVVVTNPSGEPVTITSLVDDKYGNLAGRGTCAIGATLAPLGGQYACTFQGVFNGIAPQTQTDTVTVTGVDHEGATVMANANATVGLTNVAPTITVVKSASPLTKPEPGGTYTFSVVVTNTSNEPITLTNLVDNVYGDLNGKGTCATGSTLAANGGTYSCTFPGDFIGVGGQNQTDTVTATGVDRQGTQVSAQDSATVAITGVAPSIFVEKSATPPSKPEPGGSFNFTASVTNSSTEPLTLTSFVDNVYGDLNGLGNCSVPQSLAANGGTYTCNFPGTFTGFGGDSQTDTVTGTAVDSRGREVTDTANATVTLTTVLPTITVAKTAQPPTKPEPGGDFTFGVTVTNTSFKVLTLTSLVDDVYGDLNGKGTCQTGGTLAPNGGTYTCSFVGPFTGVGGDSQTDTVTATGVDNRGNQVSAQAQATVSLTSVPPTVTVVKTPDPTTEPAPGGDFTFNVAVTNTTFEPLTVTSLVDNVYGDLNGKGTCKIGAVIQPGESYKCSFTGTFTGKGGDSQTDTVTVTAVNSRGQTATATAKATVNLTPVVVPPSPVVVPPAAQVVAVPGVPVVTRVGTGPLARTGQNMSTTTRLAFALLLLGFLMVAATWRSGSRPGLARGPGSGGGSGGDRRPRQMRASQRRPQKHRPKN